MSDIRRIVSGGQFCCNEVGKAIRRGVLKPPREFPCADCGGAATEYDHRDYNLPLVVEPVCRGCNARRGKAIPRRYSRAEIAEKMKRVAAKRRIVPWAREWCIDQIDWLCERIERHTGVTRHELRPDIFGPVPKPERKRAAA